MKMRSFFKFWIFLALVLSLHAQGYAEDGYHLWLRYHSLPKQSIEKYRPTITSIVVKGNSPTLEAIRNELFYGCTGLLEISIEAAQDVVKDGALVVGTPSSSSLIAHLEWDLTDLGSEGFRIASTQINAHQAIVIAANSELGALYGTFHFLKLLQTLQPIQSLNITQKPQLKLRLLNHWDNLDGSIERGYAGLSLWEWEDLPKKIDSRLQDYARANASLGINGAVLNNVNSSSQILNQDYLLKIASIANIFRPYGVKVYLTARFSAPIELGGLETADPLNKKVAKWWKKKVDEIYGFIPDFGGFLVKANSEDQPGPRTYNRTHAEGANMLAAALAPHQGIVIWRAFVYDMKPDYDRAGSAYENLQPFDGKFATNVLLQIKNGPIDFQPREPFHPLFGAMPNTQVMPEVQITQEYLGYSNHLVFLASMWTEFLNSDTFCEGTGSPITKVIDGSLYGQKLTGMAGVANTGSDRNWTGHHFAQANWYAFGRLAWNPKLKAQDIAKDWVHMTFTHDQKAIEPLVKILLKSREAAVDYLTPLGLHHIMAKDHYGPAPWLATAKREDWTSVYYHRADEQGIGFDRTSTGSNTVNQYKAPLNAIFGNLSSCPERYLLWFHHVPWNHRMRSGRTLWHELAFRYQSGVDWTRKTRREWNELEDKIDPQRHYEVSQHLMIQERDAVWWKNAVLLYFQTFSKLPLPIDIEKPEKTLKEYQTIPLKPDLPPKSCKSPI